MLDLRGIQRYLQGTVQQLSTNTAVMMSLFKRYANALLDCSPNYPQRVYNTASRFVQVSGAQSQAL
jgi:hypothetical protein